MLSVIIPCFNEEDIIAKNTNKILNWSKDQDFETEILIVNNNSTDKTLDEINIFKDYEDVVILNELEKGKGLAVKNGINNCTYDKVVILDADLSADITELKKEWLEIDDLLIIGSRPLGNEINTPKIRKLSGSILNFLIRKIFKIDFLDTQCGFKYISSKKLKEIGHEITCGGFLYDLDLILYCLNMGIQVKEEPVKYFFDRNSSVSLIRDPLIMLKDMFVLKRKYN